MGGETGGIFGEDEEDRRMTPKPRRGAGPVQARGPASPDGAGAAGGLAGRGGGGRAIQGEPVSRWGAPSPAKISSPSPPVSASPREHRRTGGCPTGRLHLDTPPGLAIGSNRGEAMNQERKDARPVAPRLLLGLSVLTALVIVLPAMAAGEGWYLLVPQTGILLGDVVWPFGVDTDRPLMEWEHFKSFDSATECEAALRDFRRDVRVQLPTLREEVYAADRASRDANIPDVIYSDPKERSRIASLNDAERALRSKAFQAHRNLAREERWTEARCISASDPRLRYKDRE